jgi:hypothetical protein
MPYRAVHRQHRYHQHPAGHRRDVRPAPRLASVVSWCCSKLWQHPARTGKQRPRLRSSVAQARPGLWCFETALPRGSRSGPALGPASGSSLLRDGARWSGVHHRTNALTSPPDRLASRSGADRHTHLEYRAVVVAHMKLAAVLHDQSLHERQSQSARLVV